MMLVSEIQSEKFFISRRILGSGSFSSVRQASLRNQPEKLVALKICRIVKKEDCLLCVNELAFLLILNHPHIVSAIDFEITDINIFIGLEKGTSLATFISKNNTERLQQFALPVTKQISSALNYLHDMSIIHGDLKPANILISSENPFTVKLMDLGLTHVINVDGINIPGATQFYAAPEVLLKKPYDCKADIFSFGIVIYEFLFKRHPFMKSNENYLETIKKTPKLQFPKNLPAFHKPWVMLLREMLQFETSKRRPLKDHEYLVSEPAGEKPKDPYEKALEVLIKAHMCEVDAKYLESFLYYMKMLIYLQLAFHMAPEDVAPSAIVDRIAYFKTHLNSIVTNFMLTFNPEPSANVSIFDENYDFLMEVTNSTPSLKAALEIGYLGELYYKEGDNANAKRNFMKALSALHKEVPKEPHSKRKIVIGKKMSYWINLVENINAVDAPSTSQSQS